MYPVRKDLPFYTSLRMLGSVGFYPQSTNNYKNRNTVTQIVFCIAGWSIISGSMLALIYENYNDNNYPLLFFNAAVLVASTSAYACTLLFAGYHQKWAKVLTALIDYRKFGKPPQHDQLKERGDRAAVCCFVGILTGVFLYICWGVQHEAECEMENTGSGICGVIIPTWLPSPYAESLLARRLVLLYHIPNAIATSTFLIVTHLTIQVNEFNTARIDHLESLFREIGLSKDPHFQLLRMKHCIEYHNEIIRVSKEFNNLSKRTIGHMTLTFTIVTACLGYQILQASTSFYQENAFFFEIIYVINMYIMCYCGERSDYKMKTIGDLLYLTDWYNFSPTVQKLIPLIILNSQKNKGMDAVPFGSLNYALFVTLLKTSFSYFSLLNQIS